MRRVGIIGAGRIVENAHLPVLRSLPEVDVAWITDANPERARHLRHMYRVPTIPLGELRTQLKSVDVCLLATPVGHRSEYLSACADAGVAVYCEKPFARTTAEHRDFLERFHAERIAAGFQRRFHAGIRAVRDLVGSRARGALVEVRLFGGTFDLKSGGHRFTADARLAGGGVVIESRIHELDQILFATGATEVVTDTARGIACDGLEYHCETAGRIRVGSQAIPCSCVMTRLRNLRERFEFVFEDGMVTLGLHAQSVPRIDGDELPVPSGYATAIIGGFRGFWTAFLNGLDEGQPNETSAAGSCLTTEWIQGIYEAMNGLSVSASHPVSAAAGS